MLKIESVNFKDKNGKEYFIKKHQIESFPLIGGERANMITIESWNQHGNTPINAWMDAHEGDLVFIIKTGEMKPEEISSERKAITSVCNPLNGTVEMTITLNDETTFKRDITFVSAPVFPIGFENRNAEWQKVQLLYSANNPFWYEENQIVESMQSIEPLFNFPVDSFGQIHKMATDYAGKISGSEIENPNTFEWRTGTTLFMVADFNSTPSQSLIDLISYFDKSTFKHYTTLVDNIPQLLFSFNTVEMLERRFGTLIWEGATTLADKIAKAKSYITRYKYNFCGYGKTSTYNKFIMSRWDASALNWLGAFEHANTSSELESIWSTNTANNIDANGFSHFLIYTDKAVDSTNGSQIFADYAELELEIDFGKVMKPFYMGNIIPNKVAINNGQVEAPVTITINGACTNPRIENLTTGEFIAFKDLTMNDGQTLFIDTTFGKKKVELDGLNVFNKLDFSSTFFNLGIGENSINFSDDTGTKTTKVHFSYKNLYITI